MRSHLLLAAAATLALSACASEKPVERTCPPAAAVAGTERMTSFRPGGGQDLTEVAFTAKVDSVESVCRYGDEGVEVAMNVLLSAERGPADTAREATLQYFVAIENGSANFIAKEIYDVTLPFEGNRRRIGIVEEVDITIPTPADNDFSGVRILVGLQITPEQVEYNRRTKGP
ncbi:hypothetical protein T8K17_01515 [Thalassobaculum sp. OXR-137]|uniref:hypothetical protein n=1 Tax=Thalassobaculum sp. OXR-137 TaxID=3100173 RepID=UPI002AC97B26|nr:hypothetical protein [Thalassobaculum sp. OXR-137]WPZ34827.1 hypothetical protein T8K17_01515 [Thalassobaculum sp. OXR-137]